MKRYFVAGMPRSGSTLLMNILGQNPKFHVTSTSGIMDVMFSVRNQWDEHIEFKASPNEGAKKRVIRGIFDSFYGDIDKPVIFDKCRGWLSLIEMAEYVFEEKIKILVPVRDIREVLASFEKLWRETSKSSQMGQERQFYFQFQAVKGRCEMWLRNDQPVGLAINRIQDAIQRGFADRLHFVEFTNLTSSPKTTIENVYKFLEEEPFEHDFYHVEQITWEDDSVHKINGLHMIRNKVEYAKPQWKDIIGDWATNLHRGF